MMTYTEFIAYAEELKSNNQNEENEKWSSDIFQDIYEETGLTPVDVEEYLMESKYSNMEQMIDRMLQRISKLGNKVDNEVGNMITELGAIIAVSVAMQTGSKRLYSLAKRVSSM